MIAPWYQFQPNDQPSRNHVRYAVEACHVETVWVHGAAYGRALCEAYRRATDRWPNVAGIVVVEWDVALEPDDVAAMERHVTNHPNTPATGLVRLFRDTTGRLDQVWSHRYVYPEWPKLHFGSALDTQADAASLACCYLPAWLFWQHGDEISGFAYPSCDTNVSKLCYDDGRPFTVVRACRPKHVHWSRP